jgi:class 3 adenylate cyclase
VLEAAPPSAGGVPGQPREAPVAERRLVSVLFADLVGFTNLSETRDVEETRELHSRYFELARTLIARYGGTGGEIHRRRRDGGLGDSDRD